MSDFGVEGCEAFEDDGVFDHDADCEEGEDGVSHGPGGAVSVVGKVGAGGDE